MSILRISWLPDGFYAPDKAGNITVTGLYNRRSRKGKMEHFPLSSAMSPTLVKKNAALDHYIEAILKTEAKKLIFAWNDSLKLFRRVGQIFRSSEETEEIKGSIPHYLILARFFRTIATGWKQAKVEKNAQVIVKEAGEFYDRPRVYREQANRVSVALNKAVDAPRASDPSSHV